ncbi:hypothetical protein [Desulfovibrio sp.]|uniref:hypothetical protein n=1 Tax=Desulfovibrio sp. TaxID=885 RepID=UPI003079018B
MGILFFLELDGVFNVPAHVFEPLNYGKRHLPVFHGGNLPAGQAHTAYLPFRVFGAEDQLYTFSLGGTNVLSYVFDKLFQQAERIIGMVLTQHLFPHLTPLGTGRVAWGKIVSGTGQRPAHLQSAKLAVVAATPFFRDRFMPVTAVYFMLTTVLLFLKFKATENTVIKVEFVNLAFIVAFKALLRLVFRGIVAIAVRTGVTNLFSGHDSLTAFAHVPAASAAIS